MLSLPHDRLSHEDSLLVFVSLKKMIENVCLQLLSFDRKMMQYFSLNQECQNGTQVKLKVFKIWLQ